MTGKAYSKMQMKSLEQIIPGKIKVQMLKRLLICINSLFFVLIAYF